MHKGLPISADDRTTRAQCCPLRHSIVPMLNSPPLRENSVRIICDASSRVDARPRFQLFVHDNSVIDFEQFRNRNCAHSDTHRVARNFLAVSQEYGLNVSV
jgi:hypothetical protein